MIPEVLEPEEFVSVMLHHFLRLGFVPFNDQPAPKPEFVEPGYPQGPHFPGSVFGGLVPIKKPVTSVAQGGAIVRIVSRRSMPAAVIMRTV